MWKLILWISAVLFFSVAVVSAKVQASQQVTSKTPSGTSGQAPATPTAASQGRSKEIYGYDCSMCHGPLGHGKTDLNKDATGTVSDLTDPETTARLSDKEMYDLILAGKGKMPGEKGRLKADEILDLVKYIRGLAREKPTLAGGPTTH